MSKRSIQLKTFKHAFLEILSCLLLISCVSLLYADPTELPLYAEDDHFLVFCQENDQPAANQLLEILNTNFTKLSNDFHHLYREKIQIKIFPDLDTFHQVIDWTAAPDWVVSSRKPHTALLVSPNNPGRCHTFNTILSVSTISLTQLFIEDKYEGPFPYWLKIGAGYYEAGFPLGIISRQLVKAKQTQQPFPLLSQLAEFKKEEFEPLGGFAYSYALVKFIVDRWGWDAILALFDNYAAFEEILGISQEDFHAQWIQFLNAYPIESEGRVN